MNLNGFRKYIVERGWAHVTLLAGVGVFLFPFLWMLGMSMKTDEEAASSKLFPAVPTFVANGPFVRSADPVAKPDAATVAQWSDAEPLLLKASQDAVATAPLPAGAQFVDAQQLRDAVASDLLAATVEKLDNRYWEKPPADTAAAFKPLLTPDAVAAAFDDQLSRLELRGLQLQTYDAQIDTLCPVDKLATWKVESGPAELLPSPSGAYLHYHFTRASDPPVVLRYDFPFPTSQSQLHKLIVSLKMDNSLHRLDATLDIGGQHWATATTTYIAQFHAASVTFQPPGFDDTTYQPKTWVTLKPTGSGPDDLRGQTATFRLTLTPSSTLRAIYGKATRNYLRAFDSVPFWRYVTNSVILVGLQMLGALFSTTFVAYAFARLNWPGRSLAFAILLSTMMLPGQVTMIPSFMIWKSLGWYNTLNPLWIGAWFGNAFFIFLMVQFMRTIPKELEEAARLDGLNSIQTWWYIILPLVKPTLAAIAIMVFMGAWNEFMGPLIMLRDQSRFPLSLGLFGMKVASLDKADWTLVMAGNMLMTLPVIAIFFLFQRYFIEGVTVSGMKG